MLIIISIAIIFIVVVYDIICFDIDLIMMFPPSCIWDIMIKIIIMLIISNLVIMIDSSYTIYIYIFINIYISSLLFFLYFIFLII